MGGGAAKESIMSGKPAHSFAYNLAVTLWSAMLVENSRGKGIVDIGTKPCRGLEERAVDRGCKRMPFRSGHATHRLQIDLVSNQHLQCIE